MLCLNCNGDLFLVKHWVTHGFGCALFRCLQCGTSVATKTPAENLKQIYLEEE